MFKQINDGDGYWHMECLNCGAYYDMRSDWDRANVDWHECEVFKHVKCGDCLRPDCNGCQY